MQQIFVLLALTCSALAFGTINEPAHIGQHSEHERLTRAAFGCPPDARVSDAVCFEELSLMQLAGTSGPDGHVGRGFNGAVGSPDTLDPVPEGPEAHCDNADFLDSVGLGLDTPYPRTREEATLELQNCINHLRERFGEGLDAADKMVDSYGRISEGDVDIQRGHCTFSFPELQMHMFSRSKCSAIEGFGRALHGVQDFYAHSNWADQALPPYGADNPPGLKRDDNPRFLDLRAQNDIAAQVPSNLSTGCFGGILTDGAVGQPGHPLEPGSMDCTGRITHYTLNKDNGLIDPVTGVTRSHGPNTPRSNLDGNFQRAVTTAIKDSRRQWMFFREELRRLYGTERGNMMVCSLVRDRPTKDCYGRRVALVQDFHRDRCNDGVHLINLQMPNVQWLKSELEGRGHNEADGLSNTTKSTSTKTGESWAGEMQIPLVQAAGGHFDISSEFLAPAEAIDMRSAINALRKNTTIDEISGGKSAIIALTSTRNLQLTDGFSSIWHAGDYGFRVHLGLLPPKKTSSDGPLLEAEVDPGLSKAREEDLMTAVLRTGGTYGILHHQSFVHSFLEHVVSRGLTQIDNGRDTATLLPSGLTIGDYVAAESEPRRYNFDARALQNAVVSVSPVTSRLTLRVSLRHVRKNTVLKSFAIGDGGNATFRAELSVDDIPRGDAWFELEIAHMPGDGLVGSGLFEVSLEAEDVGDGNQIIGEEDLIQDNI
jgi:hypothetical protein